MPLFFLFFFYFFLIITEPHHNYSVLPGVEKQKNKTIATVSNWIEPISSIGLYYVNKEITFHFFIHLSNQMLSNH